MNDLLALAVVRRLLKELGYELGPEPSDMLVGPLELWLHERRPDLEGRSPLETLGQTDGEATVRLCLERLLDLN